MAANRNSIIVAASAAALLAPSLFQDDPSALTAKELKDLVTGLGYETKALNEEAGKEKYEFKIEHGGYNIWIATEVSPSKNYVWLTVNLGDAPAADSSKNSLCLKRNSKIQPSNFYITDAGKLMLGVAMDNRGITATSFRRVMTKLAEDTAKTDDIWNSGVSGTLHHEQ